MSLFNWKYTTVCLFSFLIQLTGYTQTSALKLEEIMAGDTYIGYQPTDFRWAPNSEDIYFRWNKENELVSPYYQYNLKSKTLTKVENQSNSPLPLNGFVQEKESKNYYFKVGHSIYQQNGNSQSTIYTNTNPYQLIDVIGTQLIIQQENNLFSFNTEKNSFLQLTNFSAKGAPSNEPKTDFLTLQQEELFETVRAKKAKQAAQKTFNSTHTPQFISPFYLDDWNLDDSYVSQDLNCVVFKRSKYPKNTNTDFIQQITSNGYARSNIARAKVGSENPKHELYIWDLKNDSIMEVDLSSLTGIKAVPEFYANYPENKIEDYKKEIIPHIHGINQSGTKCLIEIKSYDNKDRWLGYIDLSTGTFTEIDHQHDKEWIGGPGITGWNMVAGTAGWTDSYCFYYQSEKSGYSHLYLFNTKTQLTSQLTTGQFEIHNVELANDKKSFYLTANKTHPGNREFYKLNIETKKLSPVLTSDGNHQVRISPDEKWLLVNYSYKNKPWELYIAPNKAETTLQPITHSTTAQFETYDWRTPDVIQFKAEDGQLVNARIYEPTPDKKNGAAIFFVHGAGYLQNAHNWWSGYHREYMFNNLLCDLGFTVMDVDYRASKGYGKKFRTDIYRHMGGKDLSDYVDARKYLIENHGIDPNRIGIYGGSYGGFITIMAMLTEPDKFKCGAAVRSVTDWAHYNHAYTSNILNTPSEDPIAFKQSSPIYFAENLQGRLLMLHGMVDDNVQYQDVVRLSQRFIELGKKDWDLVGYPVEPHGFKETTSWVDEYGRILKMFQEELLAE